MPHSTMRHVIEDALRGTGLAHATRILTQAEHPPSKYARDSKTKKLRPPGEAVRRAAEVWLRRLNNIKKNLWAGKAEENQRYGNIIAEKGRKASGYEKWLYDVEPGSNFEKEWNANP